MPGLGHTISEKVARNYYNQAMRNPAALRVYRNLYLNQRVSTEEAFLEVEVVADRRTTVPPDLAAADVFIGMDISFHGDLSALVALYIKEDVKHLVSHFWIAVSNEEELLEREKTDALPYRELAAHGWLTICYDGAIDYSDIARTAKEYYDNTDFKQACFDYAYFGPVKAALILEQGFGKYRFGSEGDVLFVPFSLRGQNSTATIAQIQKDFIQKRVTHHGSPILQRHLSQATIKQSTSSDARYLQKGTKQSYRVDGAAATLYAYSAATRYYNEYAAQRLSDDEFEAYLNYGKEEA